MDRLGTFVERHRVLYYLLNLTWGLLLNVVGFILMIILIPWTKIRFWHGTFFVEFKSWDFGAGFTIGMFIFTCELPGNSLLDHEFGHTVQNAILGPLTLLLVSIPSMIRFWWIDIRERKGKPVPEYDKIWFEGNATYIGGNLRKKRRGKRK